MSKYISLKNAATNLNISIEDIIRQAECGKVTLYFENDLRDLTIIFRVGEGETYIDHDGNERVRHINAHKVIEQVALGTKIKIGISALKALRLTGTFLLEEIDWHQLIETQQHQHVSWTFDIPHNLKAIKEPYSNVMIPIEDIKQLSLPETSTVSQITVQNRLGKARHIYMINPEKFNDKMNQNKIWEILKTIDPTTFTHGQTEFWKAHKELKDKIFPTLSRGRPTGK